MESGRTHTIQRASRSTWLLLMLGIGFCAGGLSLARQGNEAVGFGVAVGFGDPSPDQRTHSSGDAGPPDRQATTEAGDRSSERTPHGLSVGFDRTARRGSGSTQPCAG